MSFTSALLAVNTFWQFFVEKPVLDASAARILLSRRCCCTLMELSPPPPFEGVADDIHGGNHEFGANSLDEGEVEPSFDNELPKEKEEVIEIIVQKEDISFETMNGMVQEKAEPLSEDEDSSRSQKCTQEENHLDDSKTAESHANLAEEDDDWGDFDSAPHEPVSEDWGVFEESSEKANADADDWAADFVSASTPPEDDDSHVVDLDESFDDDGFWDGGFGDVVDLGEISSSSDALNIVDFLNSGKLSEELDGEFRRFARLWLSLRIVEEACALKHDWKHSQLSHRVLGHLRIDPEVHTSTLNSVLPTTSLIPTFFAAPSGSKSPQSDESFAKSSSQNGTETYESSVPVVDFDWDTSGLTNPLKGAGKSSAIMDIDFLSANSTGGLESSSTLQKDLDDFGLGSSSTTAQLTPESNRSVLETILSTSGGAKKPHRGTAELSLDARALHDQLPDISYLRASIIMFPMGGGPWHNSK
ncbi:unnamed protein product [Caenorhabditis auriculariae]|uniref:Aftiphilin clathrin-binding box domain-containing protein n=1 Tax=Caenorhabditis auriculariae TaxID=2777116 RepID=A0A8S1HBZ9_9PELO|nr:unnamed protein product [Caenorhabditis auriculariae]